MSYSNGLRTTRVTINYKEQARIQRAVDAAGGVVAFSELSGVSVSLLLNVLKERDMRIKHDKAAAIFKAVNEVLTAH